MCSLELIFKSIVHISFRQLRSETLCMCFISAFCCSCISCWILTEYIQRKKDKRALCFWYLWFQLQQSVVFRSQHGLSLSLETNQPTRASHCWGPGPKHSCCYILSRQTSCNHTAQPGTPVCEVEFPATWQRSGEEALRYDTLYHHHHHYYYLVVNILFQQY